MGKLETSRGTTTSRAEVAWAGMVELESPTFIYFDVSPRALPFYFGLGVLLSTMSIRRESSL